MTAKDHAQILFDEYYDLLSDVVQDMSLKGRRNKTEAARQCALMFIEQMQVHCNYELAQYWRDVETELHTINP